MNVFSRAYIDSLYDDFLQDAGSLSAEWQQFFENFDPASEDFDPAAVPAATPPTPAMLGVSAPELNGAVSDGVASDGAVSEGAVSDEAISNGVINDAASPVFESQHDADLRKVIQLQDRVDQLIRGYRVRGHLEAAIDPLGRPRDTNSELNPESYGLSRSDFQDPVLCQNSSRSEFSHARRDI